MNNIILVFKIFQFAADYATTHLMKNLMEKVVIVKKMLSEKSDIIYEPKIVPSITPENLTPQMRKKVNKMETFLNSKPITSADDSTISLNKHKQDSVNLKKDYNNTKNIEDVVINPSSYLLRDGSINFSKLLIDEVLAADKLLIEAAKLTYDIAGNILFSYLYIHGIYKPNA